MNRKTYVVVFSLAILMSAFVVPYLADPAQYSLREYFMAYVGAGTPFFILSVLSAAILIKNELSMEAVVRRFAGIALPYILSICMDYKMFNSRGNSGEAVIGYLLMILIGIPVLYVVGFGTVYIIQDYRKNQEKLGGQLKADGDKVEPRESGR